MRFISCLLLCLSSILLHGQSVGLFLNTPEAYDGYTLVAPSGATRTHLIDNCGSIINQWDSEYRTGESAYLLEDGSLLRTCRLQSDFFTGGGIGGRVERFNWEGDLVWSFEIAGDSAHHHHDVAHLPNGNVVMLCWEYVSPAEAAFAGRQSEGPLWPPVLYEIQPEGNDGGQVVWEWHAWDHLVQDADTALPNFGDPAQEVTRLDVNYGQVNGGGFPGGPSGGDWFHCNAVGYNAELDHLILNSRNWNEFYIIDHGTTTEEAAGPDGDLLYRWGNPQTYGRGDAGDRVFYMQHDAHWIAQDGPTMTGSDPTHTVLVYNNGNGRPSGDGSSVDELELPWDDALGRYTLPPDGDTSVPFAPLALDWSWPELPSMDFHSHNISGAQRLPNGNTLICEGNKGKLFEISAAGDIVWEYWTAYNQWGPIVQGDNAFGNSTFRAYRYAPDYPAFEGRDMTPGDPVEANPLPFDCELHPAPVDTTTTGVEGVDARIHVGPNPAVDFLDIAAEQPVRWELRGISGRVVARGTSCDTRHRLNTTAWPAGLLMLQLFSTDGRPLGKPRRILIHS